MLVLDVYARLSDDRGGKKRGVDRQLADGRDAVDAYPGAVLGEVLKDKSKSAWKRGVARPDWDRAMDRLRTGASQGVWIWYIDRFVRQPRDLEELIDHAARGAVVLSGGSKYDLSDPDDRHYLRGQVAAACKESDRISARVRRANDDAANDRLPIRAGRRSFGYERDGETVRLVEARIARECDARASAGEPQRAIAADLNRRGVLTAREADLAERGLPSEGTLWSGAAVRDMLLNPRLAGLRVHRGAVVGPGQWEPIIEPAHREVLVALLTSPSRRTTAARARAHLLVGFAVCGRDDCGATLRTRKASSGATRDYCCQPEPGRAGCGRLAVREPALDAYVTEAVLARVESGDVQPAEAGGADALLDAITTCDLRLAEAADDEANDRITREQLHVKTAVLRRRQGEARAALATTQRQQTVFESAGLRERWAAMTLDQRRAVLDALVERVVVHRARPGRTFDSGRVEIIWR